MARVLPSRAGMRAAHALLWIYCLVCLAALVWPGYALVGDRVEPYVLGLPFSLAWNVGWVALTFVVLAVFDRARARR